jgi:AcrR family transcriptional regulator
MPAADRRQAILDAALGVFAKAGYHEASLEAVAARAGISKALIYEHFESKQDLYIELLNKAAQDLLGLLVAAASAPGMEGALRMENAAMAGFQYVQDNPHAFHMFVRDVTDPLISERQETLRRDAVRMMADVMEMEPPETRAGMTRQHTEQLAEMIVAGYYALADWWLRNPSFPRDEVVRSMLQFMWLGLGRLQEGERWELRLEGNVRTDTETPSRDGAGADPGVGD